MKPVDQTFLVGHHKEEAAFKALFDKEKLHHAWLVTGPKGIGKATFVHHLTRMIVSKNKEVQEGGLFGDALPAVEGVDESLIARISSHTHPQVKIIESEIDYGAGSAIKVDEVRAVSSFLRMTPSNGGWRVVLVDSIDMLNPNAANALLKLLEEPPEKTLFFLISHSPGKLLPTIRSRCRLLRLSPLEEKDIDSLIARQFQDEPVEDVSFYKTASLGSFGRFLKLYEMDVKKLSNEIDSVLSGEEIDLKSSAALLKSAENPDHFMILIELLFERILENVKAKSPVAEKWMAFWDRLYERVQKVNLIHLDRRQVFLSALFDYKRIENH